MQSNEIHKDPTQNVASYFFNPNDTALMSHDTFPVQASFLTVAVVFHLSPLQLLFRVGFGYGSFLQNHLRQRPYQTFESITLPTTFLFPAKFIQTYVKFGGDIQTATILNSIHKGSLTPSSTSYSKLLSQCTASKFVSSSMEVHAYVVIFGLSEDRNVRNHLVNLYSKCRCFGYAQKLVEESTEPNLVSWSALISGYAQNGLGKEAILAFHEMHLLGVK